MPSLLQRAEIMFVVRVVVRGECIEGANLFHDARLHHDGERVDARGHHLPSRRGRFAGIGRSMFGCARRSSTACSLTSTRLLLSAAGWCCRLSGFVLLDLTDDDLAVERERLKDQVEPAGVLCEVADRLPDRVGSNFRIWRVSLRPSAHRESRLCINLAEARAAADLIGAGHGKRYKTLTLALAMLSIPAQFHRKIARWKTCGGPPLSVFTPYADYVFRVDLDPYAEERARVAEKSGLDAQGCGGLAPLPAVRLATIGRLKSTRSGSSVPDVELCINDRESLVSWLQALPARRALS